MWGAVRPPGVSLVLVAASVAACSGFGGADDVASNELEGNELESNEREGNDVTASALGTTSSAADWSCLGGPPAAAPAVTGAGNVTYSVLLRSLLGVPLSGVLARVCQSADLDCATPLGEFRGLTPESLLAVNVPLGFAGFLEIEADGHLPTMFQLRKPVLRDTVDTQPLQPLPIAAVGTLTGALNVEAVPELAIVSVAVVDCREQRAPGASFSNNLGGRGFYFSDGVPSVTASSTDISGLGGFINVPIRLVEITAELEADGRVIGVRNVLPRAGWLNVVQVRPPAAPYD